MTRLAKLLNIALFVGVIMCYSSADAGIIPIYISSGGRSMTFKEAIGLLIALNTLSFLIVLIRSFVWFIKKPDWTYIEYVWYSNTKLMIPDMNTLWLVATNVILGVATLAMWIPSVL